MTRIIIEFATPHARARAKIHKDLIISNLKTTLTSLELDNHENIFNPDEISIYLTFKEN